MLRALAGKLALLVLAPVALSGATLAGAQQPPRAASLTPRAVPGHDAPRLSQPTPSHALEKTDLEAWLDGMIPAALEQGKVGGAVVSVVKDGHLLLAKGYGYADIATKTPMDPYTTLVRPGSTSKLFTWTAVMQLVEQGKIDLNADVNRYLDFKIPQRFGRPIMLTDIMTHRAGFEEGLKDAIVSDPARLQPLDIFLKNHVRPVLFAPGEVPAYSNYGTALAGYIVQRVSGERFDDYIARHIFAPLNMRHATFRQPLPRGWDDKMSRGYMSTDGAPKPFELISFAPAGSLSATAADMANFMIAHLQDGQFGSAQILRPQTAALMHSASLPHPAGFDAMAHGFFLLQRNGRTVLEHGGDTIVFHSDLAIIPSERSGIFFSFNSRGGGDAVYGMRERLLDGFMNRYFPAPTPITPAAVSSAAAHGAQIAGRYESSRRVQSGFMSLFYVLQGQEMVSLNPDATIALASAPGKSFREVAPFVWQEVGGTRRLAVSEVGGIRTIADSRNPAGVLQPVPLGRNASVNLSIFTVSLLLLLAAAVAWPVAEVSRRVYRQPPALAGRLRLVRRLARSAVVADLIYLLAWFAILKPILGNEVSFYTTDLDPLIRGMQIAAIVPVAGAGLGLWNAGLTIRSPRSWITKIGSVLVAGALVGVVWIAYVGGLMSFTLNY